MDDEGHIDEYSARGTRGMRSPRPLLRAQRVLQIAPPPDIQIVEAAVMQGTT
jgi:hypothetical protein